MMKSVDVPRSLILNSPYTSIPEVVFDFKLFELVNVLGPLAQIPSIRELAWTILETHFDTKTKIRACTH
jgi:hypothetical protein